MEPPDLPITVIGQRWLGGGNVAFDAISPYGRRLTVIIPFWNTTAEGIHDELRKAWAAQLAADADREAVLASYAADERDPYAVDDPDADTTAG